MKQDWKGVSVSSNKREVQITHIRAYICPNRCEYQDKGQSGSSSFLLES